MKHPMHKEELLVWPSMGIGVAIFVASTLRFVFPLYHALLTARNESVLFAGYLFPLIMAMAFALRLHGKYWLGFVWLGLACYALALLLGFLHPTGALAYGFILATALALLFSMQGLLLFAKRVWWQPGN